MRGGDARVESSERDTPHSHPVNTRLCVCECTSCEVHKTWAGMPEKRKRIPNTSDMCTLEVGTLTRGENDSLISNHKCSPTAIPR